MNTDPFFFLIRADHSSKTLDGTLVTSSGQQWACRGSSQEWWRINTFRGSCVWPFHFQSEFAVNCKTRAASLAEQRRCSSGARASKIPQLPLTRLFAVCASHDSFFLYFCELQRQPHRLKRSWRAAISPLLGIQHDGHTRFPPRPIILLDRLVKLLTSRWQSSNEADAIWTWLLFLFIFVLLNLTILRLPCS